MFGKMIDAGPKFYVVRSPNPVYFCIAIFYNFSFFLKPSMDFIHLWRDDRASSKILRSTIPIPVHGLKVKVTDFEYFVFNCYSVSFCKALRSRSQTLNFLCLIFSSPEQRSWRAIVLPLASALALALALAFALVLALASASTNDKVLR